MDKVWWYCPGLYINAQTEINYGINQCSHDYYHEVEWSSYTVTMMVVRSLISMMQACLK